MSARLEIVAVGARTPVGMRAESSAAAVRAGIVGVRDCLLLPVDDGAMPQSLPVDAHIGFEYVGLNRITRMAETALIEVTQKLGPALRGIAVEVVVVLPELRPGIEATKLAMARRQLTTMVSRIVPGKPKVGWSPPGPGGVAATFVEVLSRVAVLDSTLVIVVAADSYFAPATLQWLQEARLFGEGARNPIMPGEAAGCVALAVPALRKRLGLPTLAGVAGAGIAVDPVDLDDDDAVLRGQGMIQAIRNAMAGSQLPAQAIDTIYADLNGERYRSEEWGFVCLAMPTAFRAQGCELPSGSWGDTGAATAALACVLAAASWSRNYAAGPRALSVCGSYSGQRGAIVLEEPTPT